MSLGTYIHANSAIHRLSPGSKVLGLAISGTVLFIIDDWRIIAALLLVIVSLYKVANIPLKTAYAQIRPTLWLFVLIFLFQLFVNHWTFATLVTLRFVELLLLASLVTLTTPVSEMIEALEKGLRWLRFLGLNPAKVSLALSLALRFIPVVAEITGEVREAQKARGLERSIIAVALPVVIRTLKMADAVADAIEARSYNP